mgnify:CR=1 FL=1
MKPFRVVDTIFFWLAFILTRWITGLPYPWLHGWVGGLVAFVPVGSWMLFHWALVDWHEQKEREQRK